MSDVLRNFTPYSSVTAAPTGASAVTNLPASTVTPVAAIGGSVWLQNIGSVLVHAKFVTAAGGTADANSMALMPGFSGVFDIGPDPYAQWQDGTGRPVTGIALFAPAGTGSINIVTGVGN